MPPRENDKDAAAENGDEERIWKGHTATTAAAAFLQTTIKPWQRRPPPPSPSPSTSSPHQRLLRWMGFNSIRALKGRELETVFTVTQPPTPPPWTDIAKERRTRRRRTRRQTWEVHLESQRKMRKTLEWVGRQSVNGGSSFEEAPLLLLVD